MNEQESAGDPVVVMAEDGAEQRERVWCHAEDAAVLVHGRTLDRRQQLARSVVLVADAVERGSDRDVCNKKQ